MLNNKIMKRKYSYNEIQFNIVEMRPLVKTSGIINSLSQPTAANKITANRDLMLMKVNKISIFFILTNVNQFTFLIFITCNCY